MCRSPAAAQAESFPSKAGNFVSDNVQYFVGGLGASLLLPAMQSLIHGNFTGAAQKKAYAMVGAAAAIAAAVGPLLGGFITTYLSWRIAFLGEVGIIAVVRRILIVTAQFERGASGFSSMPIALPRSSNSTTP